MNISRGPTDTTLTLTTHCPQCRMTQEIVVDAYAFGKWKGGELIQRAFPKLTPSQREALITGYCNICFNAMARLGEEMYL